MGERDAWTDTTSSAARRWLRARVEGRRLCLIAAGLALVLCLGLALPTARAQAGPQGASAGDADSSEGGSAGRSDEVLIGVDSFGVGETARQGSWAGIRLRLTNRQDVVRAVAVQLHLRDDDGDTALYTRGILLNARATEATWIYAPMPWNLTPESRFVVTVHEFDESAATLEGAVGRRIAATRIGPSSRGVTDATRSLIGVIGQRPLGLTQYELLDTQARLVPTAHESTDVRTNLLPALMPDSWLGLQAFETLVWTDAEFRELGTREDPRVRALIEWVHRGGHLVVVMPPLGGDVLTGSNPLLDPESTDPLRNIMPIVRAERVEDVDLESYRGLLTTAAFDDRPLPSRTAIHVFEPIDRERPLQAIPLLRGADGTVVVRRIVGAGMVTLIGLDLYDADLAMQGTLRADAFWNRVLGRRVDIPLKRPDSLFGGRESFKPDGYIAVMISRPAAAGVGVILALVVFGLYWLLAGPGGFGLLKLANKTKLAWLAFVVTAALFTGIGWVGATAIKQTSTTGQHVTFFDHVYGSNAQRARMWTSVMLPEYGEQAIAVGDPDAEEVWNNALTTWSAPNRGAALEFPDARGYAVSVRALDERRLPVRSTTKDLQIDWAGRSSWKMPAPIGAGWEPRLEWPAGALVRGVRDVPTISGRLAHDLPGSLRRVIVILVTDQVSESEERDLRERGVRGPILSNAYIAQLSEWAPGATLDLAQVFAGLSPQAAPSARDDLRLDTASRTRFRRTTPPGLNLGGLQMEPDRRDGDEYLAWQMLSLFGMLPPLPDPQPGSANNEMRIIRRAAHGLDVSAWLTQPSVIVIGVLEDEEAPVPVSERSGGAYRPIPMEGTTVVRWIFPLEARATRFSGVERDPERAERLRTGEERPDREGQ